MQLNKVIDRLLEFETQSHKVDKTDAEFIFAIILEQLLAYSPNYDAKSAEHKQAIEYFSTLAKMAEEKEPGIIDRPFVPTVDQFFEKLALSQINGSNWLQEDLWDSYEGHTLQTNYDITTNEEDK